MAKGHIWDRERVLILVAGIGVGLKARFIRAHANNFPYLQTFKYTKLEIAEALLHEGSRGLVYACLVPLSIILRK